MRYPFGMRWISGLPGGGGLQLALKEVRIWVGEVECARWAHLAGRHRVGTETYVV